MHRLEVLLVTLLLAACAARTGAVQCGTCAGPGYVVTGGPDVDGHRWVTECVAGLTCVTHEERGDPVHLGQRTFDLPAAMRWEDIDGVGLTVRIRTPGAAWSGHGTLHYRPGGGNVCDCPTLSATVALVDVTPSG
jgi:hypothetical protein